MGHKLRGDQGLVSAEDVVSPNAPRILKGGPDVNSADLAVAVRALADAFGSGAKNAVDTVKKE